MVVGMARDSRANAYRVARREAARWCVHGRVVDDRPARVDVVVDRCSGEADARRRRFEVMSEADWPVAIAAICRFVVESPLASQPNSPILWENRVRTLYHTGGDWKGAFDASIERLPRARNLYETAMEFSQTRWGGKPTDIERVVSLARKHNPGAAWVDTLRTRHADKADV